jgi:hypothetical protein
MRLKNTASELAGEILEEFKRTRFSEYASVKKLQFAEYEHYESMVSLLARIVQLRCETPCRLGGNGCVGACPIIECAKGKSFEGCWECSEYKTCERFDSLKPFCGDTPVRNLGKIKEFGIEAWAKHRGKFYPWLK